MTAPPTHPCLPLTHLLPEVPVQDQLLAHPERVLEYAGAVGGALGDDLLQLVQATRLKGHAHGLLVLALLAAPGSR